MLRLYRELLNELIDKLDDIGFEANITGGFEDEHESLATFAMLEELKKVADMFE